MASLKLKVAQLRREGQLPSQFDAVACWRGLLPKPVLLTPTMKRLPASSPSANAADAAPVDDDYAAIARELSDNVRSYVRFLFDHNAVDCPSRYPQADIAEELGMSKWEIQWCRKTIGKLAHKLIESKDGRGGGVWLSPVGAKVASRIQPQTCLQFRPTLKVKTFSTGSH